MTLTPSAAPAVAVTLAPDQPVPHIYVGEPLIAEFLVPEDTEVHVQAIIESQGRKWLDQDLGLLHLPGGQPRWEVIDGAPAKRGRYELQFLFDNESEDSTSTHVFCRIDRPLEVPPPALRARIQEPSTALFRALAGIPVAELSIEGSPAQLPKRVMQATDAGFRVSILLNPSAGGLDESALETLAKDLGPSVELWEVDARSGPNTFIRSAHALRRGAPHALIAPLIGDPEQLAELLKQGADAFLRRVTIRLDPVNPLPLDRFREVAERFGFEGLAFDASYEADGDSLGRRLTDCFAQGYRNVSLDAALLYGEEGFGAGFCPASSFARNRSRGAYVGNLSPTLEWRAEVFRRGEVSSSGGTWSLVLWSRDASAQAHVPVLGASQLTLVDALNNPLPLPDHSNGELVITATGAPRFLSGKGGPVLKRAAYAAVHHSAESMLEQEDLRESLGPELVEVIKSLAESSEPESKRFEFFSLIRTLPDIEARRTQGLIPRAMGASVAARVSRLARKICTLEQETGTPFLELLHETLERCGEYQTLYLMGSSGSFSGLPRGDWILGEVSRLVEEAGLLQEAGRPIEANAVAALAEWRARSLKFAGETPLQRTEDLDDLTEAPDTETEEDS